MSLNRKYEESKKEFDLSMEKVVALGKLRAYVSAEAYDAAKQEMSEAHDKLTQVMWQLSPLSQPKIEFNPIH